MKKVRPLHESNAASRAPSCGAARPARPPVTPAPCSAVRRRSAPEPGGAVGPGVFERHRWRERLLRSRIDPPILPSPTVAGASLELFRSVGAPVSEASLAIAHAVVALGGSLPQVVGPGNLSVVFQPIVDLRTMRPFAYEALTRCDLPELRSPDVLFEVAAATGFVGWLGRLTRRIAVALAPSTPLFLNVHPLELREPWLVRSDDPMHGHDAEIFLEVTETLPFVDAGLCNDVLREIGSRSGIFVAVDDLGAGYSNLLRIAELAPAIVKLDRSLVRGVDHQPRKVELVTALTSLCERMGAGIVAEGIETLEELRVLRDAGVHYGQGYLLARPAYPAPSVGVRL